MVDVVHVKVRRNALTPNVHPYLFVQSLHTGLPISDARSVVTLIALLLSIGISAEPNALVHNGFDCHTTILVHISQRI